MNMDWSLQRCLIHETSVDDSELIPLDVVYLFEILSTLECQVVEFRNAIVFCLVKFESYLLPSHLLQHTFRNSITCEDSWKETVHSRSTIDLEICWVWCVDYHPKLLWNYRVHLVEDNTPNRSLWYWTTTAQLSEYILMVFSIFHIWRHSREYHWNTWEPKTFYHNRNAWWEDRTTLILFDESPVCYPCHHEYTANLGVVASILSIHS